MDLAFERPSPPPPPSGAAIDVAFLVPASTRTANGVNRMLGGLSVALDGLGVRTTTVGDSSVQPAAVAWAALRRRLPPPSRRLDRADLVHVPVERLRFPDRLVGRRVVVTVTGLGGLSGAYRHPRAAEIDRRFMEAFDRIRHVATVVALTASARRHVCDRLGLSEAEVAVIHLGVDHSVFHPDRCAVESPAPSSRGRVPYVVHVGPFSARKNTEALLRALASRKRSGRAAHRLVLVGRVARRRAMGHAHALGLADDVITTGVVPDEMLARIYRGAAAVCMPSRYEGFGLPVVEAMACGTPVIVSGAPALVEVAGGAALVVDDVDEPDALASAIGTVLESTSLAADLRRRGIERAGHFTWERCARAHREVYRQRMAW